MPPAWQAAPQLSPVPCPSSTQQGQAPNAPLRCPVPDATLCPPPPAAPAAPRPQHSARCPQCTQWGTAAPAGSHPALERAGGRRWHNVHAHVHSHVQAHVHAHTCTQQPWGRIQPRRAQCKVCPALPDPPGTHGCLATSHGWGAPRRGHRGAGQRRVLVLVSNPRAIPPGITTCLSPKPRGFCDPKS